MPQGFCTSSVSAEKVAFDPEIVDINRVEVLRGPQGTVLGSGSMGGTIRIIPNKPDSTKDELSLKNILSTTQHANGPTEVISGIATFTPDEGSLSLLGAQLTFRKSNLELSLFGRNLLDQIARTALERDVSLNVPDRLRYAVNTPRTVGLSFSYRQ